MNFARNFTALRKKKDITQEKMAEKCGVSRPALAKWESGSSVPNLYMVDDIAKIFEVSVDELLHGQMEDASDSAIDIDYATHLDEKMDKMKAEIIAEFRKIDSNVDLFEAYCQYRKTEPEEDDDIPAEAYYHWAEEAEEKGDYTEAIKYLEEALARGHWRSAFILLRIYDDITDLYAQEDNESEFWKHRLIQAQKMQQYGKIIETEIKSGRFFH